MTGLTSFASALTSAEELATVLGAAASARRSVASSSPEERRCWLTACARSLEESADTLVAIAQQETRLLGPRLRGEIVRTVRQLELYGSAIEDRTPSEAQPADTTAVPPMPEILLTGHPIGVVLVFAASNFPFAFGVAGTDTASALAAGCPVVVKAHPGHLRLSVAIAAVIGEALDRAGAPAGTFGLVVGDEAGVAALEDPRISAGAFTGSLAGGRYLHSVAAGRTSPIPFYGELGSVNPVLVAPSAAAARGEAVLTGYVDSFLLGSGQFCTKPGLLFWPAATPLPTSLVDRVQSATLHPLLNPRIEDGFERSTSRLAEAGARPLAGDGTLGAATHPSGTLWLTTARSIVEDPAGLLEECFGPSSLVATYDDDADLLAALECIEGTLTASIHADPADTALVRTVLPVLEERAGRLVWGEWPTGVAVSPAQHHGGPFPATTAPLHTSVGTHAIDRFVRPIAFQGFPPELLRR